MIGSRAGTRRRWLHDPQLGHDRQELTQPAPTVLGLPGIQPGAADRSGSGHRTELTMRDPSPDGRLRFDPTDMVPPRAIRALGGPGTGQGSAPTVRGPLAPGRPIAAGHAALAARSSEFVVAGRGRGMVPGPRVRRNAGMSAASITRSRAGGLSRGTGKETGAIRRNPARPRRGGVGVTGRPRRPIEELDRKRVDTRLAAGVEAHAHRGIDRGRRTDLARDAVVLTSGDRDGERHGTAIG